MQLLACSHSAFQLEGVTATKSLRLGAVLGVNPGRNQRDFGGQLEAPDPDPLLYGRSRERLGLFRVIACNNSIKSGSEQ